MLKDNKMCFEDGEEVKVGDYLTIQIGPHQWAIFEMIEATVGEQLVVTPDGKQQVFEQKQIVLLGHGELQHQMFPLTPEIASMRIEHIIEAEYEVLEVEDNGQEIPNESGAGETVL